MSSLHTYFRAFFQALTFTTLLSAHALLVIVCGASMWMVGDSMIPLPAGLALCVAALAMLQGFTRYWVITPLKSLITSANRIAACDLSHTVTRSRTDLYGQLQGALEQVGVNLKSIVRDARDQNLQTLSNIAIMSSESSRLAQRTEDQASRLTDTTTALGQVSE